MKIWSYFSKTTEMMNILFARLLCIKRTLVCCRYLLTFGRCPATPPAFFGTPKVSNEWLRTLIALLRWGRLKVIDLMLILMSKSNKHNPVTISRPIVYWSEMIYLKVLNESSTTLWNTPPSFSEGDAGQWRLSQHALGAGRQFRSQCFQERWTCT